jgi:hypothetical protein
VLGVARPAFGPILAALGLGAVSYGLSVVLDAYALRALGAAREAAIFATAPFVGAALAVPLLSDDVGFRTLVAGAVMAIGVAFTLTERHTHVHTHDVLAHDHVHVHDEHHQHQHAAGADVNEPHSHEHRHDALVHAHPHVSDVHHRHDH